MELRVEVLTFSRTFCVPLGTWLHHSVSPHLQKCDNSILTFLSAFSTLSITFIFPGNDLRERENKNTHDLWKTLHVGWRGHVTLFSCFHWACAHWQGPFEPLIPFGDTAQNFNTVVRLCLHFIAPLAMYDHCGGLTYSGCQVPTQPLSHSSSSAGEGEKIRWKTPVSR